MLLSRCVLKAYLNDLYVLGPIIHDTGIFIEYEIREKKQMTDLKQSLTFLSKYVLKVLQKVS